VSSAETDKADRRAREAYISRNLAEARQGRDRIRDLADQEAPEKDDR
jgi:F0F1-type ATP synthase membrane subunit b/b'